jgi:PAS domain-containing protein
VNRELRALTQRYARALQGFLSGRGEAALQEAYELGREALARGLGVHDLATIQHRALLKTVRAADTREERSRALRSAGKFFVEGILPFEMSHRRSQEVNAALRESEERYRSVVDTARDVIFTLSADS